MRRPVNIGVVLVFTVMLMVGVWVFVQASGRESSNEPPPSNSSLVGEDLAFGADGSAMAYCVNSTEHGELWVDVGEGHELVYTGPGVFVYNPVWSPDGAMIAFAKVPREEGPDGSLSGFLCYVDTSGAAEETELRVSVNRYEFRHEAIQWSSDSRRILVCPTPIALWDVKEGRSLVLADIRQDGRKTQMASLSPSGGQVAFKEITDDGMEEVLVVDLASLSTRVVSCVAATAHWDSPAGPPQWLSESALVFLAPKDGDKLALIQYDMSLDSDRELAFPAGHFVVSPDRKTIACIIVKNDATANAMIDVETAFVTNCPGTTGELMSWSPDNGRLLLYDLGGARSLNVYSLALSPLVTDCSLGWRPAWSPDSRSVALSLSTEGVSKLSIVTVK